MPCMISAELAAALEKHGVKIKRELKPEPAPLYDANGLWLNGVPDISAWGHGCGLGSRESREERRLTETRTKKL